MRPAERRIERIVAALPLAAVVRLLLSDLVEPAEERGPRPDITRRREAMSDRDRRLVADILEAANLCLLAALEARLRVGVMIARVQGLGAEFAALRDAHDLAEDLGANERARGFAVRVADVEGKLQTLAAEDPIAAYRAHHRGLLKALAAVRLGPGDVPAPIAEPLDLAAAAVALVEEQLRDAAEDEAA